MPQVQDNTEGRAAYLEDYDSDESRVVEGTVVTASALATQRPQPQQRSSSSRQRPPERSHRRDATIDSGHVPHASTQIATTSRTPVAGISSAQPPHVRRLSTVSPTKSKPVIHRVDSARSAASAQQQSHSNCTDKYCRDPGCSSKPNLERRYTSSSQQQRPKSTQPQATSQYPPPEPQYHYQAAPMATTTTMMMPPPPRPQPDGRPRQARPVSIHAGYPPPASSAYYYQNYQPASGYYGTTPPTQTPISYMPQSPSMLPQSSPIATGTYPGYPGYAGPSTYSTRQPNPAVPGLEYPKVAPLPSLQPGLSRTFSARVPNVMPEPESTETESDSESNESEVSETEEEYRRRIRSDRRRSRAQEEMVAVVPARRPSVRDSKKYRTDTAVPTRTRRESLRIEDAPRRSDTALDYLSSDRNDSDRTARATVSERRSTTSSARGSRRPSVSTTASSGRTKATSLSSGSGDYHKVIIEDPSGRRRTAYLSKDQQSDIIRRMEQAKVNERWDEQRLTEEKVAAYQRNISGEPYELSAHNLKDANRKSGSHSNSHVSRRSKRSSDSGSKMSKSDGIVIQTGGTVLHIHGDSSVQVRPGEDGGSAQITIGSVSGRDSGYHGSKSSSSRIGRSRGGSEFSRREKIREEVEYDSAGYEIAR
ncbi:hypothetical protein CLAFUW4_05485 [Fulvia fulva]|uniref:Uncharacterized protein n=1 Tax=Passalora fulva TaxID=5499 RepID=A0A9Q8LIK8_PASFU|nr:uncharacterized protein CLAFUR5_05628 [Fulvia fulva]KAK4624550.1 hypothetical protein CLAFUR4_05479 [Fulvia fulva]KAK4625490.1 hypothetical protein CLAFUR0_05487 [Fulvia fulva]UJO18157.1 hypothetical protein CLAFUR5_05628 [Fulvia fulva]WPV14508.1 hypothetical protein CLAFUW4_05485 [Fulvia fulva]WPV29676.1 hypothetical protein CLAFUW7_05483 [Fulvia fulva]